jgi:replicative DNA helicase
MTNANNYGKPKVGYEKKEKQREDAGLSDYVFGKVMPQALQLEEAVLGALMLDTEAFSIVSDILKPESFYADQHQLIYKAIVRLFESSNPVDLLTVTESLKKAGDLDAAGGGYYMVELTHRVASAANIEYHARILQQKSIQRQIISASTNAIRDAYEDTTDVFDLLDRSETALFKISQGKSVSSGTIIGSLAHQAVMFAEKATEMQGLTGVPSGLTSLDRFTGGFQDSDLIIVAARPGMGKTAAVLTFARNAAKEFGKPVAFFSLEMPETQLGQRLTAAEAGVNIQRLRTGKCDGSDMQALSRARRITKRG